MFFLKLKGYESRIRHKQIETILNVVQLNLFCILENLNLWVDRESQQRCPVDNEPFEEKDLFADNFAKREIQNFNVKCPNSKQGCDTITSVKQLQVTNKTHM